MRKVDVYKVADVEQATMDIIQWLKEREEGAFTGVVIKEEGKAPIDTVFEEPFKAEYIEGWFAEALYKAMIVSILVEVVGYLGAGEGAVMEIIYEEESE